MREEKLKAIFNNLLSEKMREEKLKAKLDKYPCPENVKGLRTLKVNQGGGILNKAFCYGEAPRS